MRTYSKTQKYSIAHNFFSFDCNIGMLHLIFDRIDERNPTEKEFFKLELPSSHNYRLGTVKSKSFVGEVLLRIKWKFELHYTL